MRPILLLHGGAGSMEAMDAAREATYREGLRAAARAGSVVLEAGGSALDAVVAVNAAMEDSGIFNAGLGACMTSAGTIEMDAAIMRGTDRAFGAVTGIPGVANPVRVARAVMEHTPHCMLTGEGAERFARQRGLPFRQDFPSEARREVWRDKLRQFEAAGHADAFSGLATLGGVTSEMEPVKVEGESPGDAVGPTDTVGAVALDAHGGLAAAVSTGGIWLKLPGRVGDSPLPGAGLWALDGVGAAVATGTGETILRVLLCREVVDRVAAEGAPGAARSGIALLERHFGPGMAGVIALGPDGEPGFALNTNGMGRALWRGGHDSAAVAVWPDEDWDRPVA